MRLPLLLLILAACWPVNAQSTAPTLNAKRAFGYLEDVCAIGRRVSGSTGMQRQQKLVTDHFTELGFSVRFQSFEAAHPITGRPVRMANFIAQLNPKMTPRILLCCHYDTRPFPDQDSVNKNGIFLGANDGASGVALYMEMAHHLPKLTPNLGVDIVMFDGEELVFPSDRGKYFLGSEHFAKRYKASRSDPRYACGVLVDMIGDKELRIYKERNSLRYASAVTNSVWKAARQAGESAFVHRMKHEIRDDHIPLNRIARIPTCDLIDFDYGRNYWHTTRDIPRNCSGESLAIVGRVLCVWLVSEAPAFLHEPRPQRR